LYLLVRHWRAIGKNSGGGKGWRWASIYAASKRSMESKKKKKKKSGNGLRLSLANARRKRLAHKTNKRTGRNWTPPNVWNAVKIGGGASRNGREKEERRSTTETGFSHLSANSPPRGGPAMEKGQTVTAGQKNGLRDQGKSKREKKQEGDERED